MALFQFLLVTVYTIYNREENTDSRMTVHDSDVEPIPDPDSLMQALKERNIPQAKKKYGTAHRSFS